MDYNQLLRNLMVMAAADGKITSEEMDLLRESCRRWQVSENEFHEALEYARADGAEFTFQGGDEERRLMLEGFVEMMGADGDYADVEMKLFIAAAHKMGVGEAELNRIIDSVLDRDDLFLE